MALSIKTDEADALARELAAETHETLTEAVTIALRERLARVRQVRGEHLHLRLEWLADWYAELPASDSRTPDEIIGYDQHGLPT